MNVLYYTETMCGIVLLYNPTQPINDHTLEDMTASLKHRGPDAQNCKIYEHGHLGIGHTRLSLVDLTAHSNQPLEIDNYSISFNGEIYNYQSLREELKTFGYQFITTSDTEVIIRSVQHWGIDLALSKFNGCFAFFLYDKKNHLLHIARDPLGEKQLVYTTTPQGEWLFASEIKSLIKHPDVKRAPNINRFIEELIFNIYSEPSQTFFENIHHFPPGHYFTFDLNQATQPSVIKYWDLHDIVIKNYTSKDLPSLITTVKELLTDAVNLRLQADCEIGSILSGGLDSSFISALGAPLHQQKFGKPMQCFTVYYDQKQNRDLNNARLLAAHYPSIQLNEVFLSPEISIEDIKQVTLMFEEPLTDKSEVALHKIYHEVQKQGLKATLNGQGSDEHWLGYVFLDDMFMQPKKTYSKNEFTTFMSESSYFSEYIKDKCKLKNITETSLQKTFYVKETPSHLESLTRYSLLTHLAGIFRSEDRIAMDNSIEVRLPFLDPRLVSAALSIPARLKIADKREKYILRKAAQDILPKSIITRKKQGFPHPPLKYDIELQKQISKEFLKKSQIISEIFGVNGVKEIGNNLPIREQWVINAFAVMENVYFS